MTARKPSKKKEEKSSSRPEIAHFEKPADFLRALYVHYKKQGRFSISQRMKDVKTLSQAMVSQILSGKRNVTIKNLAPVAEIFKLTPEEKEAFQLLTKNDRAQYTKTLTVQKFRGRDTKNHIFSDWLNPYVKDLVSLQGFAPEPLRLYKMLFGLATPARIRRSIDFLLKEGFWVQNKNGAVVPEDMSVFSTADIPSSNIRSFHKKALEIAKDGLEKFPVTKRRASTHLITLDKDKLEELRKILEDFDTQIYDFVDRHPEGKEYLIQVVTHLTPVAIGLEVQIDD